MSAAPPPPKPVSTESDVDAVIEKIDAAIPKIRQRLTDSAKIGRPPSDGFTPEKIQQAKAAFAEMSEDSLLTKSGESIRLEDEDEDHYPGPAPSRAKMAQKAATRRVLRYRRSG